METIPQFVKVSVLMLVQFDVRDAQLMHSAWSASLRLELANAIPN